MKYFNLAVVVIWLSIFGLSIRPNSRAEFNVVDRIVYHFNSSVADICHSCVEPPRMLFSVDTAKEQFDSLEDNAMTNAILVNTFWALLFFMVCINIAYYTGRGTFGGHFSAAYKFLFTKPDDVDKEETSGTMHNNAELERKISS